MTAARRTHNQEPTTTEAAIFGLDPEIWEVAVHRAALSAIEQGLPLQIESEAALADVARSLNRKLGEISADEVADPEHYMARRLRDAP